MIGIHTKCEIHINVFHCVHNHLASLHKRDEHHEVILKTLGDSYHGIFRTVHAHRKFKFGR